VAALPFAWRAVSHLDVNLFNQASGSLKRFALVRDLAESFGGDILAAVVTLPDNPTPEQVQELKQFGDILASELATLGTRPEDRDALSVVLREEIERASLVKKDAALSNDAANTPDDKDTLDEKTESVASGAWLRQVECRTGQVVEKVLTKIARQQPHVILHPSDVDTLKALFQPAALEERLNQVADDLRDLPPQSVEVQALYNDPLGVADLGKRALKERIAKRKQALVGSDGYLLSPDRTTLVIIGRAVIPATRLDFNRALMAAAQRAENRAIETFRKTQSKLVTSLKSTTAYGEFSETEPRLDEPNVLRVGFTGMPAITVENEISLKFDVVLNTATSLLGVLILFLVGFRSLSLTWDVTWTTSLTILLTVAFAGATKGSISLLGSAFTAVPVGLGTDYAILIYNTYHALRNNGLEAEEAMRQTLSKCGPSILTAALITSLAFFGMALTHLVGLAEFGILGGVSAIIGSLVMLLILPTVLCRPSMNKARELPKPRPCGIPAFGRWIEKPFPRALCLLSGVMALVGTFLLIRLGPDPGPETVAGVKFDPELGNMRLLSSRAVPLRERVTKRFDTGLADLRVVVSAENEELAFEGVEEVQKRLQPYLDSGELSSGGNILEYLPSPKQQRASLAALKNFDSEAASEAFKIAANKRFGARGALYFKPFLKRLQDFRLLTRNSNILTLSNVMAGPLANLLAQYVKLEPEKNRVQMVSSWFPKSHDNSAQWYNGIAARLETHEPSGPVTIYAKPPYEIKMTAARMVGFELKEYTLADTGLMTLLVGIGVSLSLILALKSFFNCMLATIPLIFAYVAMLAGVPFSQMMGWDFSLNFVNLIMFPLLLGSAIDYGVYMVFDARSPQRPPVSEFMSRTGLSVLYCMGTTLIGFGSFVTSSYTGLISMGVASLYGYMGALFGALVVLPAILGYIRERELRTASEKVKNKTKTR
jgi:predicted RND superfamily exporter protein